MGPCIAMGAAAAHALDLAGSGSVHEIDLKKLPEASRNWINQKLIYTHGYGITMNTANGFTPEGMPRFLVSNMPVESTSADIKVTRPEIYYGQETSTEVYVKTKQKEFDYPQGETNTYTTYQGNGGIRLGGPLRRMCSSSQGLSTKLKSAPTNRP